MSPTEAALGSQAGRAHPPMQRRPDEGMLGGVCAGLAHRLDLNVKAVRILVASAGGLGGLGAAAYLLSWAVIPIAPESRGRPRRPGAWREALATVIGIGAFLWVLRRLGFGLEQSILWPAVVGVCGLALVWRQPGAEGLPGVSAEAGRLALLRAGLRRSARADGLRVLLGVLMVSFASAALLHHFAVMRSLGRAIGAVALVTVVVGALGVPWFLRLWRSLAFERSARIREQERAEVAAHLHDSVLQTLALIQKRAGDPREVAGLARRQERELRSWLHEGPATSQGETVASALRRAAGEVEELHGVPIEVVTVGDGPLEVSLEALVLAAREAMTNAAKFARSERIDLYAEVQPGHIEVFVRDRGVGFDTQAVPEDRRGLRDSIVGRMERHRGLASIRSRPGEGTEVELKMGEGLLA
jgi:signal transduction histidine kinase/phage shock protein PspC (stress-responsive transcriptional regulator)